MIESILSTLIPYIVAGIAALIVAEIKKIVPIVNNYIEAKAGTENYKKMKAVAIDIFGKIEEDGRLGELADTKLKTFADLLKAKFPAITDEDINLLNKSIAWEFNQYKTILSDNVTLPTITADTIKAEDMPIVEINKTE